MTRTLTHLRTLLRPPAAGGAAPAGAWRLRGATLGRARRAVLSGVVIFVLSCVGLNVALDTVKPEWRDPE